MGRIISMLLIASVFATVSFGCATGEISPLARQSYNLGNALAELGEYEQAKQAYLSALSEHPDYRSATYNLAVVYERTEEYQKALELIASEVEEGDPQFLKLQAYLLNQTGQFEEAARAFRILAAKTEDNSFLVERAKSLLNAGTYEAAGNQLKKLLEQGYHSAQLFFLLGEIERESEAGDGMGWYRSAVVADPSYQRALEKVLARYAGKEADELTRRELNDVLSKAVQQAPDNALIRFELGRNLLLLGEREGLAYIEEACDQGFSQKERLIELYEHLSDKGVPLAAEYAQLLEDVGIVILMEPAP